MTDLASESSRRDAEFRFIHDLTQKALELEVLKAFWPVLEKSLVDFFHCERATLFLLEKATLRSVFAGGLREPLVVKLGEGIAGAVALTGKALFVNEPNSDPRFLAAVDQATGFKTKNLLCATFTHENRSIGVIELLNKPGGFREEDRKTLVEFSPHIGFVIAKLNADEKNLQLRGRLNQVSKISTLGMLLGGVAHELGAPLSALEESIDAMREDPETTAAQKRKLEGLKKQTMRCRRIASNLLDSARRSDFALERVAVPKALTAMLALAEHQTVVQDVSVSVEGPEDLPDVQAGLDQLQQVFLNLITNSLQAMRGGGTLRITMSAAGGFVRVVFADNGDGIPASHLERLFEPHFTTRLRNTGTGLGLSICKDLVERFGGRLSGTSPGKGLGAEFTIELPVYPEKGIGTKPDIR